MSTPINVGFASCEICELLVGITPVYLQNFVQRKSFNLRASVMAGKAQARRRLFSRDDVYGLALVWMLFETGLRPDSIARILNDITGSKKASPNLAAKKLLEAKTDLLTIIRYPRGPSKKPAEKPKQETRITSRSNTCFPRALKPNAIVVVIPVGAKFRDLKMRLEVLFPSQGA